MIIRHSCSSLLRCRKPLRVQSVQNSVLGRSRAFHASSRNLLVNESLQLSSAAFHVVHDLTGLSWAASIPLTAGLYQLVFSPLYYLIEINLKKRSQATNLLFAWREIYKTQALQDRNKQADRLGHGDEKVARQAEYEVAQKVKAKAKQLKSESGYYGSWLGWTSLSYLPVWFSNLGALRRMCGTTEPTTGDTVASGIVLEPAFLNDGGLWFSDLTVADPTFLLPLTAWALMGVSFAQVRRARGGPALSALGKTIQNLMVLVIACFGPLLIAWRVPSATILAIIGSTSVAIARRAALDRVVGNTRGVMPAKARKAVLKKHYRPGQEQG